MEKIITKSKEETEKFAEDFAKQILLAKSNLINNTIALVIGLYGNLGTGKTTFTQGFAKGLCIKQKIISPTFVILKIFKITKKSPSLLTLQKTKKTSSFVKTTKDKQNLKQENQFSNLIHIDAYRLENPEELLNLGWYELIKNPQNIVLVEWADKIKKILPKNYLIKINFKFLDENKREIIIVKFKE